MTDRNRIFRRFSKAQIDSIRLQIKADFENFGTGYPLYHAHLSKVVADHETSLGVSATQIESYKTVQNFVAKGMKPRTDTLRFFQAYLQIREHRTQASEANIEELFQIGSEIQLKHYPTQLGRPISPHNRKSTRVFVQRRSSIQNRVFGSIGQMSPSEYIRKNEVVDRDEAMKAEYKLGRSVCICMTPHKTGLFDLVHVLYLNPHISEEVFDHFMEDIKRDGFSRARENFSSNFIEEYLVGFAFYDGEVFEGVLVSRAREHIIKIKGFSYYNFHGDNVFAKIDRSDIIPKRDPYGERINCFDLGFTYRLNLEFHNLRTGIRNNPYGDRSESYFNPILPWHIDDFDPRRRMLSVEQYLKYAMSERKDLEVYLFPKLITSSEQFIQITGPLDHVDEYSVHKAVAGRELAFLSKFAILNFDFNGIFDFENDIDW